MRSGGFWLTGGLLLGLGAGLMHGPATMLITLGAWCLVTGLLTNR